MKANRCHAPRAALRFTELDSLIAEALKDRPDLAGLTLNRDAAYRFADAEKAPALSVDLGIGDGRRPPRARRSVAWNLQLGGYKSEHTDLEWWIVRRPPQPSRAQKPKLASSSDVQDLAVLIARDVRFAWLEANTAFRRLDVTTLRLVSETDRGFAPGAISL